MYRIHVLPVVALLVFISFDPAHGAIPGTIPFQASVKTAGGAPVASPTTFVFRLYASATAPVPEALWSETQILTPQAGLISTTLGATTSLNLPFDAAYWVGVQMGTDAEMTPRLPLGAVPYALFAASAANSWNLGGNSGTVPGTNYVGTADNQALEVKVNGQRAMRYEPTTQSPNIIGGTISNTVMVGAVGAVLAGGGAPFSGMNNSIFDSYCVVTGGEGNQAGTNDGDQNNSVGATVSGGFGNKALGAMATVSGGWGNHASGYSATVAGGESSTATGEMATVGGGAANVASGGAATVPGGRWNAAAGNSSLAAGWRAKANHDGAFVWGDSTDTDFASTGVNQFLIRAAGNVGINANDPAATLDVNGMVRSRTGGFRFPDGSTQTTAAVSTGPPWVLGGNTGTVPGADFVGTADNQALEIKVNGQRVVRYEPTAGAPNLIGGYLGNAVKAGAVGSAIGGGGASISSAEFNIIYDNYGFIGGGRGNRAGSNDATFDNCEFATIGGGLYNQAAGASSFVGGGYANTASGYVSTIGGGYVNQASGSESTISGGHGNTATGVQSFIGAGVLNQALGYASTVGGGYRNISHGQYSGILGGSQCIAGADYDAVAGGSSNQAIGGMSFIGGGEGNVAGGSYSAVPGGYHNVATGYSSLAAGFSAKAQHDGTFVWADSQDADFVSTAIGQFLIRAGGGVGINANDPSAALDVNGMIRSRTAGFKFPDGSVQITSAVVPGAAAGGDLSGTYPNPTIADGAVTDAKVASGITYSKLSGAPTTLPPSGSAGGDLAGSYPNPTVKASAITSLAWGLSGNAGTLPGTQYVGTSDNQPLELKVNGTRVLRLEPTASSPNVVGGYSGNQAKSGPVGGFIGGGGASGGAANLVMDDFCAVGGGSGNKAGSDDSNTSSARYATVAGGSFNTASGGQASIGGGASNTASGLNATVPGGFFNIAAGQMSFAAGRRARANHDGSFVWGDITNADIATTGANQFLVRSSGGARFYSDAAMTVGVDLPPGGGAWAPVSDRNVKRNLQPVDTQAILKLVSQLPMSTWNYVSQPETIRHIGPMAQDFAAAFRVGENDTHISTIDADGVALAAIQGLNRLIQDKDARIAELERSNAETNARLLRLERLMEANGIR